MNVNVCIATLPVRLGFVTLPVSKVCTRNPAQTWLTLQPPANADSMNPILLNPGEISSSISTTSTNFISSASANNVSGSTGVQLRVSVRYKSVDVLPISAYLPLYTVCAHNCVHFMINVQPCHVYTSFLRENKFSEQASPKRGAACPQSSFEMSKFNRQDASLCFCPNVCQNTFRV